MSGTKTQVTETATAAPMKPGFGARVSAHLKKRWWVYVIVFIVVILVVVLPV